MSGFRTSGYMLVQEPVIELPNGEYQLGHGKFECDLVGCVHCHAVIKIVLRGVHGANRDTKYRCVYCDGPICNFCAEELKGSSGKCFPMKAQVEFKLRQGFWPASGGLLDYREVPLNLR